MTVEIFVGIAFGLWIAILYSLFRHHMDKQLNKKMEKRPVVSDTRGIVMLRDPLLHDADLVWSFGSNKERMAFIIGVEAGRDFTITAMKKRRRIPAGYDLDFVTKADQSRCPSP